MPAHPALAPPDRADYRPDIDGLRAIAVCAVIAFHARSSWIPGGFVGVDIFFVISGYLISRHIVAETLTREFSLIEFYRRRIRRIMPMMFTVVGVVTPIAVVFMTREDGRDTTKSAVWSVFSLANVFFWRELDNGYFANSSAEVPLLHLWSLGIEEQFYLCWPLLLCIGLRYLRPKPLLVVIGLLGAASFAYASRIVASDPSFAYYMLPARSGELLVGALLGVATILRVGRIGRLTAHCTAWVGAGLLVIALWGLSGESLFPGWSALLPTLGAGLIIHAGESGRHPLRGLGSKPMVFIGSVSYSAYLWHWPLFALFRYGYGQPDAVQTLLIILATMVLAWLSFEWIERPTRRDSRSFATIFARQYVAPAILVVSLSSVIIYGDRFGIPLETRDYHDQVVALREDRRAPYTNPWICQRQRITAALFADPACVLGSPAGDEPSVLLWGDSNAAHFVPMLGEVARHAGFRFRNAEAGSCPPLLGDIGPYVEPRRRDDCIESSRVMRDELGKYPVLVIAGDWVTYDARSSTFLEKFTQMIRQFTDRGQTVVLFGRTPILQNYDRRCDEKALRIPFKHCSVADQPIDPRVATLNQALARIAGSTPRVAWFDPTPLLCPNGRCGIIDVASKPKFYDAFHLTVSGSLDLGHAVIEHEAMPRVLTVRSSRSVE